MDIGEYKRSLKSPGAEEFLDLVFFRPAAYVVVKAIAGSPVTPNQVTMLSLAASLAAAWSFSVGSRTGMAWGAVLYALANLLDCADGQLARLQKSGTVLGRVVDGAADYLSGISIVLGLGVGMANSGMPRWGLVILAGFSSALHALFFDLHQNEFLTAAAGEKNQIDWEMDRFDAEVVSMRSRGRGKPAILLLQIYLLYLGVQQKLSQEIRRGASFPAVNDSERRTMIRLWSFLGPTTNRSILIVCALFGRIDAYLWMVVVGGNAWLILTRELQARVHRRTNSPRRAVTPGQR